MGIEKRIKNVIATQLNISIEEIKNDASLARDLGADSLDTVEIIMAMEDEFNQSFTDDNINIATVQDIIDYVSEVVQHAT
jgi:acyl carrier protein